MAMFPKPRRGSDAAARRARRQRLAKHRKLTNLQVLERDSFVCQHCGAAAVHAHHVFGRAGSVEHEFEQPESRLSLDAECHRKFHHAAEISKEELIADLKRALAK